MSKLIFKVSNSEALHVETVPVNKIASYIEISLFFIAGVIKNFYVLCLINDLKQYLSLSKHCWWVSIIYLQN